MKAPAENNHEGTKNTKEGQKKSSCSSFLRGRFSSFQGVASRHAGLLGSSIPCKSAAPAVCLPLRFGENFKRAMGNGIMLILESFINILGAHPEERLEQSEEKQAEDCASCGL